MRQLTLDLHPDTAPRFENFVVGANAEAVAATRLLAAYGQPSTIYLWGAFGSGRTHLLAAALAEARASGRAASLGETADDEFGLPEGCVLCVDDVETLDTPRQAALFRAFIRARERRTSILIAGAVPPSQLEIREDVRTRIGQCLVFELHALDDAQKEDVLAMYGLSRGLHLDPDLIQYLLRRGQRDLPSLLATIDALDEHSLARHRVPTLPLLRELLQAGVGMEVATPGTPS